MSATVRVLVVAPAPLSDDWAGGISNFVRSFVKHMPTDFEVSIAGVAGRDEEPRQEWQDLVLAGRDVRFLPVASLARNGHAPRTPVKARAMWGLLAARPHVATSGSVVQVHAVAMDLPLLMRRAPIIRVVHNSVENLSSDAGTGWRRFSPLLRGAEHVSIGRAANVFYVDRPTFEHRSRRADFDAATTRFLANGVDTDEFRTLDALEREAVRHRLAERFGVAMGSPWLLFCGRLDRQKDPELLIATFARVRTLPGLEKAQLLIVGAGPLEDLTKSAAREAGVGADAHFVGTLRHDELPAVMAASDVLLLTSAYEAAPFVVLEALASGLPVVSTAVGNVAEVVRHKETGWVAAAHDADELARGVAWVMGEAHEEIGPRAAASLVAYRISDVLAPFYDAHRRLAEET